MKLVQQGSRYRTPEGKKLASQMKQSVHLAHEATHKSLCYLKRLKLELRTA